MKELPYFRFTPSEWQNGKISLEEYELQGFFLHVCSYYWISDCSITLAMLSKRYKHDVAMINQCLELGIFRHNEETDFITISFLNEQFDTLSDARKKRQVAGSKGGIKKGLNNSNAIAMLQQKSSYKDKDKDKDKDKNEREEKEKIPPQKTYLNSDYQIQIENLETELITDSQWVESLARFYKFDLTSAEKSISIAEDWIKKFVLDQKNENVKQKPRADAFSHCKRWINTQLKNGKTSNGNQPNKNIATGGGANLSDKRPISSCI